MLEKASCQICTVHYMKGEVAALFCGHTFHLECIERWLVTSKTCPSCRTMVRANQIIKQLFFNEDSDETISLRSDSQELESTVLELQQAKQEVIEWKKRESEKEAELIHCRGQLNHQHDMVARKETIVANMREKMRWLEMMQEESKDMKKECDKLKDALTACEFYKHVVKSKGEGTIDHLRTFCVNGDIQVENYINLVRQEASRYKKKALEAAEEVRNLKKQNAKLVCKERELKDIVKALTEELEETRASCNKNTPYNPKLKPMLDRSPIKRISIGFDDSMVLNTKVFDSAIRKAPSKTLAKPPVMKSAPSVEEIRDLDHFFELEEAGAIRIENAHEHKAEVVQLTDGSFMNKRSYESRNDPTPTPYISATKKAHLRMEAENEHRTINLGESKKEAVKQLPKPTVRKVNRRPDKLLETKKKNARLSTFFKSTNGKVDVIEIE